MPNYLLAYKGGLPPKTEEEVQAMMQDWGQWFGTLGAAVVDNGDQIGNSRSLSSSGELGDVTSGLSGYSVIKSDNMDSAVTMASSCPVLGRGGTVDVYETLGS